MPMLSDRDRGRVRELLSQLEQPVRIVNFTQDVECHGCSDTRSLLEEIAALSDRLTLDVHDFVAGQATADELGVDKIPGTVLIGDRDRGVRLSGTPAGYELASLLEGIRMVARGDSGLSAAARERLRSLEKPLHVQVFVTPT